MFFLVFNEMGSSAYKWTALIFKFSHRVFFVLRGLANLAETRKPTCPPLSLSLSLSFSSLIFPFGVNVTKIIQIPTKL